MIMKNIFIIAALLIATAATQAKAQSPLAGAAQEAAFGNGEKLTYVVGYRAALTPMLEAGEVNIRFSETTIDNRPVYNVFANAKVFSHFRWVYDLDDTYQTWLDKKTLTPVKYSFRLREGKHRVNCEYAYDWDAMKVNTFYHNLKRTEGREKTLALTKNSFDPIALFCNLRSDGLAGLNEGDCGDLRIVLHDTIRTVTYKYIGKESYTVKKLGTFNTLKFSCTLAISSSDNFEDGAMFYIWVTDDKNRMPVYMESPIKVGSVRVTLSKYENLKYPLTSKTK